MRLYYAFITGIPGWLGLSYYEFIAKNFKTVEIEPHLDKKLIILSLLFLSWGINQIINDYLGLKEDRINAPNRPMVTGELNPFFALLLSFVLIIISIFIVAAYLEPIALIPLLMGVILNVLYEYAKGFGILGNIVFGLMITLAPVFGFLSVGPVSKPLFTPDRLSVLFMVWVLNGIMTYYTYFKDYHGDKEAGKETLVVKVGLKKAGYLGIILSYLPVITFIIIYSNGLIPAKLNNVFIILGILTTIMHLGTGVMFFKRKDPKNYYHSLLLNFRACICAHATLIALFNKELALILFIVAYILIGYIFHIYKNEKVKGLI